MYRDTQTAPSNGKASAGKPPMPVRSARNRQRRGAPKNGFWKRQARTWHWISGAVCLVGMLLFSITGITLNNAAHISAEPKVAEQSLILPDALRAELSQAQSEGISRGLPTGLDDYLVRELGVSVGGRRVEWSELDAYVALPRPGGDAWLAIDRETGEVTYEVTTRGAVAYLNDLHKGRHTGPAWSWFLDIFSVASILFCLTGLWLLQIHAGKRRSTWPLTVGGFLVPLFLALWFIH